LIIGSFVAAPFIALSGASLVGGVVSGGDPFLLYLGTNLSFLMIWLGVWFVVRFIHGRAFTTLITPAPRISWSRIGTGFAVWLVLGAVFQAAEFVIYPQRAVLSFDASRWLMFLPFVLILTPLQTTAEELLFRGYWLQGIGRLLKNYVALAVINGILFALPHMLNPEVTNNPSSGLLLFINYGLTGAALAYYTLRDEGLELALGAHAANNLFAALVVNYKDSALPTPAIFTNPILDAPFSSVTLVLTVVLFYVIVFRLWKRPALAGASGEAEIVNV
jgi:membrane protease YdiL (CAAX protease family)